VAAELVIALVRAPPQHIGFPQMERIAPERHVPGERSSMCGESCYERVLGENGD